MLTLVVYPEVSFKETPSGRDDSRRLIAQHIDPSEEKKACKTFLKPEAISVIEGSGSEWFENRMANKNRAH